MGLSTPVRDGTYAPISALSPGIPYPSGYVPTQMVATFQTGHGWTTTGTIDAATNLNDTSDYVHGIQSVKLVTAGAGGTIALRKTTLTAFTSVSKVLGVWLKVDDLTHLAGLFLDLGDTAFTNFDRYSLFATAGAASAIRAGEWFLLMFGTEAGTSVTGSPTRTARTAAQLRVTDDNTGNKVTVHWGGFATFDDATTRWPNGVVTFTFDDGYPSQYSLARKVLSTYGYPATAFVIADSIDTNGFLTLAQLVALQNQNGWDIGGHAYSYADHGVGFANMTTAALDLDLSNLKGWLLANGFNKGADCLAYPLGSFDANVAAVARKYFRVARTTVATPSQTVPIDHPLRLRALTVQGAVTTASVTAAIDQAYTNRNWLILSLHDIVTSGATGAQYLDTNLQTIADYCNTKGIPVRPMSEVLNSLVA